MLSSCRTFHLNAAACLGGVLALTAAGRGDSVTIITSKDNTLIENPAGLLSNGGGIGIFAGRVGALGQFTLRRAVLAFDVAGNVPPGSTITSVTLQLTATQVPTSTPYRFDLHPLLADWGEGTSTAFGGQGALATAGSATWLHTFSPDELWESEGGDYSSTISASQMCGGLGPCTWSSTAEMVADVQAWLDDPASNFGWLILGDEGGTPRTVKRFASKESTVAAQRPQLTIEFISPGDVVGDLTGDDHVNAADLAVLLGAWSIPPGSPGCGGNQPCAADFNGDAFVNAADLAILLGAWTL